MKEWVGGRWEGGDDLPTHYSEGGSFGGAANADPP